MVLVWSDIWGATRDRIPYQDHNLAGTFCPQPVFFGKEIPAKNRQKQMLHSKKDGKTKNDCQATCCKFEESQKGSRKVEEDEYESS